LQADTNAQRAQLSGVIECLANHAHLMQRQDERQPAVAAAGDEDAISFHR
jgi:HD-like signal output (HDOD) protein